MNNNYQDAYSRKPENMDAPYLVMASLQSGDVSYVMPRCDLNNFDDPTYQLQMAISGNEEDYARLNF